MPPQKGPQPKMGVLGALVGAQLVSDGALLRYKTKSGELKSVGIARADGVELHGSTERVSLGVFETKAGSLNRRAADNTYISKGPSLTQLAGTLSTAPRPLQVQPPLPAFTLQKDENDEFCHICCLGGDLVCCETCPAIFHTACIGLSGLPDDDWFCPLCRCGVCGTAGFKPSTQEPSPAQPTIQVPCSAYSEPVRSSSGSSRSGGEPLHIAGRRSRPSGFAGLTTPSKRARLSGGGGSGVSQGTLDQALLGTTTGSGSAAGVEVPLGMKSVESLDQCGVDGLCNDAAAPATATLTTVTNGTAERQQLTFSQLLVQLSSVGCTGNLTAAAASHMGRSMAIRGGEGGEVVRCAASLRRYHAGCIPATNAVTASQPWFESPAAEQQSRRLAHACAAGALPLRDTTDPVPLRVQVIQGAAVFGTASSGFVPAYTTDQQQRLRAVLSAALHIVHTCYDPLRDSRTGEDILPWLLRGAVVAGDTDFSGMHTAVLYAKETVVGVAVFRALGPTVAEMPIIAVRPELQGQGLGTHLVGAVERVLAACGVGTLLSPAFRARNLPLVPPYLPPGFQSQPPVQAGWGYGLASAAQLKEVCAFPTLRLPGVALAVKQLTDDALLPLPATPPALTHLASGVNTKRLLKEGMLAVTHALPKAASASATGTDPSLGCWLGDAGASAGPSSRATPSKRAIPPHQPPEQPSSKVMSLNRGNTAPAVSPIAQGVLKELQMLEAWKVQEAALLARHSLAPEVGDLRMRLLEQDRLAGLVDEMGREGEKGAQGLTTRCQSGSFSKDGDGVGGDDGELLDIGQFAYDDSVQVELHREKEQQPSLTKQLLQTWGRS